MTASQTIADQVAELHTAQAGHLPAAVAEAFAAEQRALRDRAAPDHVPGPGTPMPDGQLLGTDGEPTTLAGELAGEPAVVVFYRGAWCPYCNLALRTYQAQLVPELTARGARLVAISPQTPDGSLSTKQARELTFTVLSDPGNQIASQLGILTGPSDGARAAQLTLGLDLTQVNADGTTGLPMPTVVIVGPDSVIRWIDVHADYTTRTEVPQILAALDTLG